jgi:nucleoside-triphosphatase
MPNNVLISGKPGSGKTTLVVRLAEKLDREGFKTGGFVTEEIREGKERVGFKVRDLGGKTAVLAHIDYKGKPRVGKYGVDVQAFESIALPALSGARGRADLLFVDEIGRMEMMSPLFNAAVLEILDVPTPVVATIHQGRDDFREAVLSRRDVSVYEVKASCRDSVMGVIDDLLHRFLEENGGSREP